MAKAKTTEQEVGLVSKNPSVQKPRLQKLVIKNFRCIENKPVEIDLDDIVVLVGPNNVGKSSVLKAYEVVMSHGSKQGELSLEDFPNSKIETDKFPEIELHTIIYDNTPGEKWIFVTKKGEKLVKERWMWRQPGKPVRQGWDNEKKEWSENVPWGAPNVAKTRRPTPHRINAFDSPETQAEKIKEILMTILTERIKLLKSETSEKPESEYAKLLNMVKDLQKKIIGESKIKIEEIESELSESISQIFPDYKILFDAKPEEDLDKSVLLFKAGTDLLMGPASGYLSKIEMQGSGARRTLLWTALKIIAETTGKLKTDEDISRPHVLLLDEPEICLHPNAIRDACNVLYNLPKSGNWQVLTTTHCPIFIDISRDNTTIIKVDRNISGEIEGTTVFRPDKVQLDDDDKKRLKFLNICDPYVSEFFFGGNSIIVEGDTEYTAFNFIKTSKPDKYKNTHIIRARGKATIISLVKILNHFGANYSILHDSDLPKIKIRDKECTNPAWSINKLILDEVAKKPSSTKVRLLASIPNFELAYLSEQFKCEKPYNVLLNLKKDDKIFEAIEQLFDSLIDFTKKPPSNCIEWSDISVLEKVLNKTYEG